MKVCGIIAEYNPFHNGHAWQLQYAKQNLGADYVIVCMSGDFVQRGTPAILDKYARTRMALEAGADLVIELPAANACGSAEFFASGGVSLMDALGVVDMLCFGCEMPEDDPEPFMTAARILNQEPESCKEALKSAGKQGLTYAQARAEALKKAVSEEMKADKNDRKASLKEYDLISLVSSPNNNLGVEYCRSLLSLGSSMTPCPVPRKGAAYNDGELSPDGFSSATSLRKLAAYLCSVDSESPHAFTNKGAGSPENIFGKLPQESFYTLLKQNVPEHCSAVLMDSLKNNQLIFPGDFDEILFDRLLRENENSITSYQDITPDLGRRIIHLRDEYRTFEQFAALVKTRNYTLTRIQRALCHILLGITETSHEAACARILGFRKESSAILTEIKKSSRIPLITRPSDCSALNEHALKDYQTTILASNLYEARASLKARQAFVNEYRKQLIIL